MSRGMKLEQFGDGLNHMLNVNDIDDKSIVIDAGANVGLFIKKMREISNCRIYVIEPSQVNIQKIKEQEYKNIEIIEKALIGKTTDEKIILTEFCGEKKEDGSNRYHQWNNILGNHKDELKNANVDIVEYEVESTTISEIIENYKLETINYLKMDIEGSEYDVFENLSLQDAKRIQQLSLETHDESKNADLMRQLKAFGFEVRETAGELYAFRKKLENTI